MPEKIPPQYVYHYTKFETALEYILPGKKLKLNQLGKTNDPRESKPWDFPKPFTLGLQGKAKSKEETLVKRISREVARVMRDDWKVLCFSIDEANIGIFEDPNKKISRKFPYTIHGYSHPRMWAQYAENHRGVCLQFDREKLEESLQLQFAGRCYSGEVRYDEGPSIITSFPPLPRNWLSDSSQLGPKGAAVNYVSEHYSFLFLRKHLDWETESEYRWLVYSHNKKDEFVSIDGAIKAVLVGSDFSEVYEPALAKLCESLRISAGRISWSNGNPQVDFESLYKLTAR